MSNPTTPFSWQMPTATDLVTDLPADFEVFGQAVATSMADLLGGTSGQILAKNSNTDMDFVWIANDQGDITGITATSPLTGGGTSGAVTVGIQDALTTQKGAVQLSDSTSTTSSILAATPTAVKSAYDLADAAIAKSTVTTAGDIIYRNATVPVRLGIGTAGQVLQVNSGATAPEWATPTSGSMTVLASGNLATGTGTTTFSSISSSYLNLRLVVRNFNGSGNNALTMRVNNDTGSNYTYYNSGFGSSTARSTGQTAVTNWNLPFENFNAGNNSNLLVFDFPDYANTSTKKICFSQCCFQSADTATSIMDSIGGYSGTNAAISRIDLTYASNVNGGTYILYGVK
jgi:hypothetical protein